MKTIEVLPAEDWLTTTQAAKILGRHERTVQEWAKSGKLNTKPAGRKDSPFARLYDAQQVSRLAESAQRPEPAAPREPKKEVNTLTRLPKPSQAERALDTVSIVGQLLINQRQQNDIIMSRFESVVSLILQSQKAEADANRERLKAEREDARERWEIERKDRLERNRRRLLPAAAAPKAKRAHA